MILARLLSMMNSAEVSPPNVVVVLPEITKLMVAPGATAPDHCMSTAASHSSPLLVAGALDAQDWMPGFELLKPGVYVRVKVAAARPNKERKFVRSAGLTSLSETIAMVWPLPVMPAFHRGRTLYIVAKSYGASA